MGDPSVASPPATSVAYDLTLSLTASVATALGFLPAFLLIITRDAKKVLRMFSIGAMWAALVHGAIWVALSTVLIKTENCMELVLAFPMSICINFIYLILFHGIRKEYLQVAVLVVVSIPSVAWSIFAVRLDYMPSDSLRNALGLLAAISLSCSHAVVVGDLVAVSGSLEYVVAFVSVVPNGIMNTAVFLLSYAQNTEFNVLLGSAFAGMVFGICELMLLLIRLHHDLKSNGPRNGGQGLPPPPPPPPPTPHRPFLGFPAPYGEMARIWNIEELHDDNENNDRNEMPDSSSRLDVVVQNVGAVCASQHESRTEITEDMPEVAVCNTRPSPNSATESAVHVHGRAVCGAPSAPNTMTESESAVHVHGRAVCGAPSAASTDKFEESAQGKGKGKVHVHGRAVCGAPSAASTDKFEESAQGKGKGKGGSIFHPLTRIFAGLSSSVVAKKPKGSTKKKKKAPSKRYKNKRHIDSDYERNLHLSPIVTFEGSGALCVPRHRLRSFA